MDPVSFLLALIGIAISIVSVLYARQAVVKAQEAEKRAICFQLLERWESEFMRECRMEGWEYLQQIGSTEDKLYFGKLRSENPDMYYKIGAVYSFYGQLKALIDENMVVKSLSKHLFQSSASQWIQYLDKIDFRKTSDDADDYGNHLNNWYEINVKPLRDMLNNID